MDGSMLFDRWRQHVLWEHIGANGPVQPLLHSLRQSAYNYNGRPYPPELPLPMGDLHLLYNTWCFGLMWADNANGALIGWAMFSQMTAECPCTWQWFACFPLKIAPSHIGVWTSCNTWFIGPTGVGTQMATWSFQPFLQGSLVWQTDGATDRLTDHATQCDVA